MSRFTEYNSVRIPDKEHSLFRLVEPLIYETSYEGSGRFITVPAGFTTDFASIPWWATGFFIPCDRRWNKAAILHDYIWREARGAADILYGNYIFYEAMRVGGSSITISFIFWLGVTYGSIWKLGKMLYTRLTLK